MVSSNFDAQYNDYFDDRGYIFKEKIINFFVKDKLNHVLRTV